MESDYFYRRNLPHYQPPNASYFITFRLAGSLPHKIINNLISLYKNKEILLKDIKDPVERRKKTYILKKKYFGTFDKFLDSSNCGPMWLQEDKIAAIMCDAIKYRDNKLYELICYCIMPNHVHLVIRIEEDEKGIQNSLKSEEKDLYRITKILQRLKEYTAHEANIILRRKGQFWHRENYDHVIRNDKEFGNIVNYVLMNPVKAGLVKEWTDWKWSYYKELEIE